MPVDPPSPDLSKLEQDYQILTELHRDGEIPTYLARHNGLNRDVTITVVREEGDRSYLDAFADDAKILAAKRNPSIVPVIEGRWLDDRTFAIVRARVRGSTLDQVLSATGTLPAERVRSTLGQIAAALGWARANGVKHRRVSGESVIFQQGSGRVLLALDPWPNPSDDVATLHDLAERMTGDATFDVTEFIALLDAQAVAHTISPLSVTAVPTPVAPVRDETVVIRQKRGMGFNGRLLAAAVVLAAVIVFAAVLIRSRDATHVRVNTTNNGALDAMGGEAAGESALHAHPADTVAAAEQPPVNPIIIEPRPVPPAPLPPPASGSPQSAVPPMSVAPPPATIRPAFPPRSPDSAVASIPGDPCSSPTPSDQHRCLMTTIAGNDRALNGVYQRLITALRARDSVSSDAPDPPSVIELRAEQRRWLEDRDAACHNVGEGPLYARDRGACYADRSTERTKELQQRLDGLSF